MQVETEEMTQLARWPTLTYTKALYPYSRILETYSLGCSFHSIH